MLLCARLSSGGLLLRAVFTLTGAWLMVSSAPAAILEPYSASLTTYLPSAATAAQDIRPNNFARGVGLDGGVRGGPAQMWAIAGNPYDGGGLATFNGVRLDTGDYAPMAIDLSLYAEVRWPIGRSFSGLQVTSGGSSRDSDGYQGRNWMQISQVELSMSTGVTADLDVLHLVYGADRYIEFKRQGAVGSGTPYNTFKGVNGAGGAVEYVSGSPDTYIYYDMHGTRTYFFGGNTSSGRADWQIWKIVDPAGNTAYVGDASTASTAVTSGYDTNGNITTAYDSYGSDGRRFSYTYSTIDSVVRLTQVSAETKASGSWSSPSGVVEVARVTYGYYHSGDHMYGDDGCLKLVTVRTALSDSGSNLSSGIYAERNTLYHYWKGAYNASTNKGHPYLIKLVVGPEGYRRYDLSVDSNLDGDPDGASTSTLNSYADGYFSYDSSRRVYETFSSGQCGCSGSPNGLHKLTYSSNGSFSPTSGYDTAWKTRTIIEPPSGTNGAWTTTYFDELGQRGTVVKSDIDPATVSPTPHYWVTAVTRDGAGVADMTGTPASLQLYTHSTGTVQVKGGADLVKKPKLTPSGDLTGFASERRFGAGDSYAPGSNQGYLEGSTGYTTASLTVGSLSLKRPLVNSTRSYTQEISSGTTGSYETQYAYTAMHSGSAALMPKEVTTTLPLVSSGTNGSNSSNTTSRYSRADGTTAFTRSASGIFTYTQYVDGLVVKQIADAKTDDGSDFASGDDPNTNFGITETSDGAKLVTSYTYDALGRSDTVTLPTARVTKNYYTRLADGRLVTVAIPAMVTGGSTTYYSSVTYSVTNLAGKVEMQATIALSSGSTTTALSSWVDEAESDLLLAVDVGTVERLSTTIYDDAGTRVTESRMYFNIPGSGAGSDGTNYDATFFGYDDLGRRTRTKDPTGTISRTKFDLLGRVTEQWVGTNDNSMAWTDPIGETVGTDNMTKTMVNEYDDGGVGNGHLTTMTTDADGNWATTGDKRETDYLYDYRGRMMVTLNPQSPHSVMKYDNMGRTVAVGQYSSTSGLDASDDPTSLATNRVALSESFYDEMGRTWKTLRHLVDQSDGSLDDDLASYTWYDSEGRVVMVDGEQLTKIQYDRLGRVVAQFTLASTDDTVYADADDVLGDIVLEESRTGYDATTGLALVRANIQRLHDDKGGGQTTGAPDTNADNDELAFTAANINGRIQITAMWYDTLDRVVDTVAYGTNGIVGDGSTSTGTLDRDGLSVPSRSDTELRTTTTFNPDGSVLETTDPKALVTRYLYDDAGRKTAVIANYVNGTPSGTTGADDVFTRFEFTDGLQTAYFVDFDGDNSVDSIDQRTVYTYGVAKGGSAGDSKIASGRLLQKITYPDVESGESGADHEVSFAYNALGQQIWMKDQSGNVIETLYDTGGRQTDRCVTTLASGFDNAVLRISTTYNARGMTESVTQYDDETPGSGSVVNDVKSTFDGWGNLTNYEEDRDSLVGAGTPNDYEVSYMHDVVDGVGRNTIRRTRQDIGYGSSGYDWVGYNYLSSSNRFDDDASRVSELVSKTSVTYASYDYNGMSSVVGIEYPEPAVYRRLYGSSQGDYPDLDLFNRQINSTWSKDLSTDVNFYDVDYSYDRDSNITWSEDNVYPGRDVLYTMDNLNRLTDADEGSRSGGSITSRKRRETWTLQQVGNWDLFKLDLNGDGDWSDTNEVQDKGNFLSSGSGSFNELNERDTDNNASVDITRVYDKNGNLSEDGVAYEYEYDAFNRLRKIIDASNGTTVLHEYIYNGAGHRIGWWNSGDNQWIYFAYDEQWRMVASYRTTDTTPKEYFINHQAGMGGTSLGLGLDACVARLKDASVSWTTATDGTQDERLYYCQELRSGRADVVHLIYADGTRVESVRYSPYGVPFGIPIVDYDADGDKDSADTTILSNAFGSSAGGGSYNVAADVNLDGNVDSADLSVHNGYSGGTLGRGNMTRSIVRNRKGYAGYEHDGILDSLMHVRHRVYESELGRWVQRDPLGFVDGGSLYGYVEENPNSLSDFLGLAWGPWDFIWHYYWGGGTQVWLSSIGLAQAYENHPAVLVRRERAANNANSLGNQLASDVMEQLDCKKDATPKFTHQSVTVIDNISRMSFIGTTMVWLPGTRPGIGAPLLLPVIDWRYVMGGHLFSYTIDCDAVAICGSCSPWEDFGTRRVGFYSCQINYSIKDVFRDPLDIIQAMQRQGFGTQHDEFETWTLGLSGTGYQIRHAFGDTVSGACGDDCWSPGKINK